MQLQEFKFYEKLKNIIQRNLNCYYTNDDEYFLGNPAKDIAKDIATKLPTLIGLDDIIEAKIDFAKHLLSKQGYSEHHNAYFVSASVIENELKDLEEEYERLLKNS